MDKKTEKVAGEVGLSVAGLPTSESFIRGAEDLSIPQLAVVQGMTEGVDPKSIGQWYDRVSKAVYGEAVVGHVLEHRTVTIRSDNKFGKKGEDGNVLEFVDTAVKKVLLLPAGSTVPVIVNVKLPNYEWAAAATSLLNYRSPAEPRVTFGTKLVKGEKGQWYVATVATAPCEDQVELSAAAAAYAQYAKQWASSQHDFENYSSVAHEPADDEAAAVEDIPFKG